MSFSGLNLAPVSRLRATWERLPAKYEKLFFELQEVFDPSRNMAKYRNLLNKHNLQPPIIPLFPVIKKDLTFLHEGKIQHAPLSLKNPRRFQVFKPVFMSVPVTGNDSKVDGLVNFEKLRMIAREIRHVVRLASVTMDPALLFRTRYTHTFFSSKSVCKRRTLSYRELHGSRDKIYTGGKTASYREKC